MAYSNSVAPGHWNSYGTGTGPNQAAAIGRYQAARSNSGQWRGTGPDGRDVYYNPSMQRSYLGPRKNVAPSYGTTSNYSGGLPSQFEMPYQINQMVQSGYEDRERASAGNLRAIGQGYGRRMANSGMNLDRIAQGYSAREAAAGKSLNDLIDGYQQRYQRGMEMLDNARANELSRIDEDYQKRAATNMQDLVSRGLRNSSVAATKNMGVERARQQSIADVNEAVRRERLAADANLSQGQLAAQRDALGVRADLSGQTLNFGAQANDVQNALYNDQLRFQTGANDTQNALAGDRLRFTERTKADYPNWEDAVNYAQQMGAASAQGYGNYYNGGGGGPTWNPQTRTWQNGGGSYIAGIGVAPLSSLGYNVPNLTTMPAANLRPTYYNRSQGRSEASLNNAAARRGAIEANREFNANQRLSQNANNYDPMTAGSPNGMMPGGPQQAGSPQGRYLGGGRYSVPGSPNTFTMDHDLARQSEFNSGLAAQYRQQGLGAGYVNPQREQQIRDQMRLNEIEINRQQRGVPTGRYDTRNPWALRDRNAQPLNNRGVVQSGGGGYVRAAQLPPARNGLPQGYAGTTGLDGTPLYVPQYGRSWPSQLTPRQIENLGGQTASPRYSSPGGMAPMGPVRPNTLQDYQRSNRLYGTPMPD